MWLKTGDFRVVYEFRRRCQSATFFYTWMPAPKLQVGIVITRKEGNSVQRHRTKRQIKEIVRKIVTALPDKYKFKLIIKAKKTQTSYWEIKYEIVQNLERIQRDAQHYKTV